MVCIWMIFISLQILSPDLNVSWSHFPLNVLICWVEIELCDLWAWISVYTGRGSWAITFQHMCTDLLSGFGKQLSYYNLLERIFLQNDYCILLLLVVIVLAHCSCCLASMYFEVCCWGFSLSSPISPNASVLCYRENTGPVFKILHACYARGSGLGSFSVPKSLTVWPGRDVLIHVPSHRPIDLNKSHQDAGPISGSRLALLSPWYLCGSPQK